MKQYRYKALTPDGLQASGVVEAIDEYDAAYKIKKTCPVLLEIKAVRETGNILTMDLGGDKVNLKNLSVACQQIAITLKSGMPLAMCLEMIGKQTTDKKIRRILTKSAEDVSSGATLANSLERHGPGLPPTLIETIRAGEESGNIDQTFGQMAEYYEQAYKTVAKIKSALAYPTFVLIIAIVVVTIIMAFVIPVLTATFHELGGELPLITQILMSASEFCNRFWILILSTILAFVIGWRVYTTKSLRGRMIRGKVQLKMPVIGKISQMSGAAEFANTMSMLLKSGLTVNRSLAITAKTMTNYLYQEEIGRVVGRIEEGRPLGECLRQVENLPPTLVEMCAIGEETGELEGTLEVIGEFYANEADTATKKALARLEPAILVFLSIFAGFIVIAIYMPMFTMYDMM